MKGSPAGPGSLLASKPTRFDICWVFNRVGFFISGGVGRPKSQEPRRTKE
jgi:hypothetical protein